MNKKRRFLFTLIVVALCAVLALAVLGCDKKPGEGDDEEEPSTQLFANGDFSSVTGDTFPKAPGSWTASPGSTSSSENLKTPTGDDNLRAGVIDVADDPFRSNKKTYGNIDNPGKATGSADDDNNVLMIYNKVATSYKYTSSSVTLDKKSYYKLTLNVKTLNLSADKDGEDYGVYVYVNGDAYAAFEKVDTKGEWRAYTVYIESSLIASKTITVTLSLGVGNKETGHMTKGHAFFDNVTLENLSDVKEGETAFTGADFDAVAIDATTAKYSMRLADAEFDYASSTTSVPYTASKYTGVEGFGSGDKAPSNSSTLEKGIYDVAKNASITLADKSTLELTAAPDSTGTRILYQQNKKKTAYGFRGSVPMRFEAKRYYAFSIYVRTQLQEGKATLKITNGTNTDANNIVIGDIDTQGQWQQYTFYIEGNEKRNNDLYAEMWLGQGGANDTDTHAIGVVFYDNASLKEISADEYAAAQESDLAKKFSLHSKGQIQEQDLSVFANTQYDKTIPAAASTFSVSDTESGKLLKIANLIPSAFSASNVTKDADDEIVTDNAFVISPNAYYLISVMFKTDIADKDKGLTLALYSLDPDKKKYDDARTSVASLTGLNSLNLEDEMLSDGYAEATFYVSGAEYKETLLALSIELGTGSGSQSSGHVIGSAEINSISIERITATDYNTATSSSSTLMKNAALAGTAGDSEVSGNGKFNFIDAAATAKLYPDTDKLWNEQGKLVSKLGVPAKWTNTNEAALKENSNAGVLDTNSSELLTALNLDLGNDFYQGFDGANGENTPNVLAINPVGVNAIGYTSESISLSANSYYVFSVWAKSTNTPFSIELAKSAGGGDVNDAYYNIAPVDNNWHQYFIYVRTGVSSVSVKLTLYAGSPKSSVAAETGWVFFGNAAYTSANEAAYNAGTELATGETTKANNFLRSWMVDGFDVASPTSTLSSPANFSGSLTDTEASSDSDILKSGVFNRTTGDWSELDLDPDDKDSALARALFESDPSIGDSVLALYQKEATAYKYTSTSATLKENTYYRISVSVLTYGLSEGQTATVIMKLNNQTYTFGKQIKDDMADIDKKRLVNTSAYADGKETVGEWKTYTYYVKTDEGVTPSMTLSVGLGFAGEDNRMTGYLFADNFAVEEIDEADFIARKEQATDKPDETLIADETLVPNNYRIVFTESDAKATVDKNEEPGTDDNKDGSNLMWLWISTGVIGGVIVVVVVVYLVKKYWPKKSKRKFTKKPANKSGSQRDEFNDK